MILMYDKKACGGRNQGFGVEKREGIKKKTIHKGENGPPPRPLAPPKTTHTVVRQPPTPCPQPQTSAKLNPTHRVVGERGHEVPLVRRHQGQGAALRELQQVVV